MLVDVQKCLGSKGQGQEQWTDGSIGEGGLEQLRLESSHLASMGQDGIKG